MAATESNKPGKGVAGYESNPTSCCARRPWQCLASSSDTPGVPIVQIERMASLQSAITHCRSAAPVAMVPATQ